MTGLVHMQMVSHEGLGASTGWGGRHPSRAVLRTGLIALGLLLPLNLPFSIPPVGTNKLFEWSARSTSNDGSSTTTIVTHTTRRARAAGLRPGDVLLAIDDERLAGRTLARIHEDAAVGDTLALRVQRGGSLLDVRVPVSANLASYSGYIWYRLLVVLAAWMVGMALLIWQGKRLAAVLVGGALILIPPSAFPNGVPGEGVVLSAAQMGWQLQGAAQRILFPLLLCHFLALHVRGPAWLRSARVWAPVYLLALATVFAVTGGLTEPLARSPAGWPHDLRLVSGAVFEVLVLVAAAVVWRQQKNDANPLRWMAFAICVYAAASLAHGVSSFLHPAGPDPELMRRARALVLGLVPATAALHFHAAREDGGKASERGRFASSAAALLTVLYASAIAGVAAAVLGATQTSLNGVEWLLFLSIFLAAIVFSPVLGWAREVFDRRMLAPWAETEAQTRAFIERTCAELDPERIARRAAHDLPPLLDVASSELILGAELARSWALPESAGLATAPREELRGRLAAGLREGESGSLPIKGQDGELMGILVLGRRHAGGSPDPAEQVIARTIARGLASALRNAETYVALRRTQQELAEAERISAMGALAGGLAHEIKNPLASLKMGLHLLERDGVDTHRLRRIQWDLRRIDDLVSSLLHYTQDGACEGPEVLDLRQLARTCVDDIRSLASSRGIRIVEQYPAEDAMAVGSPNQLRLVISNLLLNALDAMTENGRIDIGIRIQGRDIELVLEDSGVGIPAANRDDIFKLGFSTKPGGTGLGLALARREIDRLHGRIEVFAGEECGTVLRVLLPRLIGSSRSTWSQVQHR